MLLPNVVMLLPYEGFALAASVPDVYSHILDTRDCNVENREG